LVLEFGQVKTHFWTKNIFPGFLGIQAGLGQIAAPGPFLGRLI
jgi:hypothetical protein